MTICRTRNPDRFHRPEFWSVKETSIQADWNEDCPNPNLDDLRPKEIVLAVSLDFFFEISGCSWSGIRSHTFVPSTSPTLNNVFVDV